MNTLTIIFSVFLSILYSVSGHPATNYPEKEALRYGFQQTHECKSFEKSFLCVRKCLDKNYDVAVSDKNCKCTCYSKKDKAKYKQKNEHAHTWVGGAPSTHLPRWYQTTGPNVQGVEDSGENTEKPVMYEDGGTGDTGGTAGPDETGEPGTGAAKVEHTGKTAQGDKAAPTGDPAAPEGVDNAGDQPAEETGGTEAAAPEGKSEAAPAAEPEAESEAVPAAEPEAESEAVPVAESEAPQEAALPAETEAPPET